MSRFLIGAIAALTILLSSLGYFTWNLHSDYVTEKNNNAVLVAQKAELKEKMEKANEVSKGYQNRLTAVDKQLAARSVRDNQTSDCVVLNTGERRPNATASGEVIPTRDGRSGLSINWLYDFAGRCEKTRQKAIGLQKFIGAVND